MRNAIVLMLALSSATSWVSAEEVPLDKAPTAVLDAIKAKFPGCEITKAATGTKMGGLIYEVYFTYKEAKMEVMAKPDGSIFLVETVITAKELPAAVAKVVEAKYPGATFRKVEEVRKITDGGKNESLHHYTIVVVPKDATKPVVLKVDPKGEVLAKDA